MPLIFNIPQNNFNATNPPTVNDDSSLGYIVDSQWLDIVTTISYICTDSTTGAAVWVAL